MKTFGSHDYPKDWETSCLWDGKVSVHFGYPADGWVLLSLLTTAYNSSLVIHLSDTWDPFWDMVDWLKAIADDDLPAKFTIDEEGHSKTLIVSRYTGHYGKYSDIEFRINGDSWNEDRKETVENCYFLTRATRIQLLSEFTSRLEMWLRDDYDPAAWNHTEMEDDPNQPYADLRRLDIQGLKEKIQNDRTGSSS
jgi:hypothetical protein